MKKVIKISMIFLCLFLLILIRKFESTLFYDPLLSFFKQSNFNQLPVPEFNLSLLFISLIFRFGLNSIISLTIIQLWFNDKKITRVSGYILLCSFLLFGLFYLVSLFTNFGFGYMPTFYIRRILIQPILLLLLVPAIYYYKYSKNQISEDESEEV